MAPHHPPPHMQSWPRLSDGPSGWLLLWRMRAGTGHWSHPGFYWAWPASYSPGWLPRRVSGHVQGTRGVDPYTEVAKATPFSADSPAHHRRRLSAPSPPQTPLPATWLHAQRTLEMLLDLLVASSFLIRSFLCRNIGPNPRMRMTDACFVVSLERTLWPLRATCEPRLSTRPLWGGQQQQQEQSHLPTSVLALRHRGPTWPSPQQGSQDGLHRIGSHSPGGAQR